MELRITERLEYDGWNQVMFKDLVIGDIVRIDDLPNRAYVVATTPSEISDRMTNEFFSFEGHKIAPIDYWLGR